MFQLNVFQVDSGNMIVFDMEMALERVNHLMESILATTKIPVNKQVLLVANGEPLNPNNRVSTYVGAGTETNPIYLFSKLAIESPVPPSPSFSHSSEMSLKEEVEKSVKMPPTHETLVQRANLAGEFDRYAKELGEMCERAVHDQQLQQQGWKAVGANLENITSAFQSHSTLFEQHYTEFVSTKQYYVAMLERYHDVIALLKKIPILPCMRRKAPTKSAEQCLVLLDWINSQEQRISLDALVKQCYELLQQFGDSSLEAMMSDVTRILDSANNPGMKEIKGLDERISCLQQRLRTARQLVQDQCEMAQGFHQNLKRAEHLGDPSVLPDLCASHQKQLVLLLKNHNQLREIHNLCARAKDELSANLHARLRWVMIVEHSICECDTRLLVYHENLKRMRRRLEIFEQVYEAPRLYILAVLEVLRRKSFSCQFLEWAKNVSSSAVEATSEEVNKRDKFAQVFGNHFLQSLFKGMEDRPPHFADNPPETFDDRLPEVSVDDIKLLQNKVPALLNELSLVDPLDRSVVVREQLSQSNLSRLVDPNQNPSLEETLELRKKTKIDPECNLTVSQIQREISQEDVGGDFNGHDSKLLQWQLGGDEVEPEDNDFKPGSLKSLESPGRKQLTVAEADASVYELANEAKKLQVGEESQIYKSATDEISSPSIVNASAISKITVDLDLSLVSSGSDNAAIDESDGRNGCLSFLYASEIVPVLHRDFGSYDFDQFSPCDECKQHYKDFSSKTEQELEEFGKRLSNCLVRVKSKKWDEKFVKIASESSVLSNKYSLSEQNGKKMEVSVVETYQGASNAERVCRYCQNSEGWKDREAELTQQISELQKERNSLMEEKNHLLGKAKGHLDNLAQMNEQCDDLKTKLKHKDSELENLNKTKTKFMSKMEERLKAVKEESTSELQAAEIKLNEQRHKGEEMNKKVQELLSNHKEKEEVHASMSKRCANLEAELQRRERDYFKTLKEYREKLEAQRESFQVELENQRAAMLLSFELEKGDDKQTQDKESCTVLREASVEEGVDAMEWERVQHQLKQLQEENKQLRSLQEASEGTLKDQLLEARSLVLQKEEQCNSLHQNLAELQTRIQQFSLQSLKDRITLRELNIDNEIMLIYDDNCKAYIAVTLGDIKYFLRSDSLKGLEGKISEVVENREWILGTVTDKEYCVAKKSQNRFKLPVGTYFYRIQAKLWTV